MQRRIDAYFPPKAPRLAIKLFNFFLDTSKYSIKSGGMSQYIDGLDQWTIGELGRRDYGIDLSKYITFFKNFEQKLLEKQSREANQN